MSDTVTMQVSIDRDIKEQADILFSYLGIDMSCAVNLFLHQCVLKGGLPFPVEVPRFSQSTVEAMKEARRIANDPSVPAYDNMNDVKKELNS